MIALFGKRCTSRVLEQGQIATRDVINLDGVEAVVTASYPTNAARYCFAIAAAISARVHAGRLPT